MQELQRVLRTPCLLSLLIVSVSPSARGGIGPENVLLVVNSSSPASLAVANHYQQLRRIPPHNVVYLDWSGSLDEIDIETYRKRFLTPIANEIERRKLAVQIDCIVYSSDFPYSINFESDLDEKANHATGSLTGLTYLSQQVATGRPFYIALDSNWYARPNSNARGDAIMPTHLGSLGFRSSYQWQSDGERANSGGRRYVLSTMLAYTSGRGNSLREAIAYLRRSALADGTHPQGTIYFVKNGDVRSAKRHVVFAPVVDELKKLGVDAEVITGKIPQGKPDVAGAVVGTAGFKWGPSGSTILPGAICEHLTSFGGILRPGAGQTPLTEFLRYGAAGSSGTVVEPFALQPKFPHPTMHLHYARGCTLAESFYQSVRGPFQLLIVGDALCRPWASIPTVTLEGIKAGQSIEGTITLLPNATTDRLTSISEFVFYVDGRQVARCRPGEDVQIDTTKLPEGHHEIRVVAIEDSLIASQGRLIVPVNIHNHNRNIKHRVSQNRVPWNQYLHLYLESPDSKSILVFQNRRPLAQIKGEKGQVTIDPRKLGLGPSYLQAVGESKEGKVQHVFSPPIRIDVVSPPDLPELPKTVGASLIKSRRK